MQDSSKGKLTRAQLMDEIIGMRRNSDKKPSVKPPLQQPAEEKRNLNKTTVIPSHHPQTEHDQELKSIISMAVSRKKENFAQLKKWDAQRSQQLQLHINAIEDLHNEVDKLIKVSIDNLETYIVFFKERAKCQEKLAASPIIDVRKSIEHNGLSKTSYSSCTLLLNLVYNNSIEEGQRCQLLANTIRKVILKERLDQHSSQSHLNLLRIRERIASLRAELTQCNKQVEKRSSHLVESYALHEEVVASRDFYELQLNFIEQAAQQTSIQKRLGELCLDYLKLAIAQEQKRRNILRQCLSIYMDALKYAHNMENTPVPQATDSSIEGISQLFFLDKLIDGRILNLIKLKLNVPEMNMANFEKYLMNFSFDEFTGKLLLLKEYNVYHQTSKNKFEPCYMVITVDRFLHLFFTPSGLLTKPSITLRIDSTLFVKSSSDISIQLKKKEQRKRSMISYIMWDTKMEPTHSLQFSKKDNKEEFCVFLKKLM